MVVEKKRQRRFEKDIEDDEDDVPLWTPTARDRRLDDMYAGPNEYEEC